MIMMKNLSAASCLLFILAPCACRKPAPTPAKLKTALQTVSAIPPCDKLIPGEWPHSLPIPTGAPGGTEFKIFFYPLGKPGTPEFVDAPLGEAVLRSDGSVFICNRLPGEKKGLASARWPRSADDLTFEDFLASQDRLYATTEKVAVLYSAKVPLTQEDKNTLQEYGRQFSSLAEPALLPYYYRLNPDFWDWLAKSGVPALSKP
jgi:hypothetical protein